MEKRRYKRIILLLCILTVVSGCAETGLPDAAAIREKYASLTSSSGRAEVVSCEDGNEFSFTLDYSRSQDSETVSVAAPAELSGVVLSYGDGKPKLKEDEIALASGLALLPGTAPADAIPAIIKDLSSSIPIEESIEKDGENVYIALTYEQNEEGTVITRRVWVDAQTFKPHLARIYVDGTETTECIFTMFDMR